MLSLLMACSGLEKQPETTKFVENIHLTWLGVTSFLIQYEDKNVLFDAFFSRPKLGVNEGASEQGRLDFWQAMERLNIDTLDAVLIGHSHYDHAIDVGIVAKESGADVYGSSTTCLIAQAQGLAEGRCHVLNDGDQFSVGQMNVQVARTIHWWPEQSGIGGAYDALDSVPDPEQLFVVPHGGVLSYLMEFSSQSGSPSIFFQDSLGPLHADDGSGEEYRQNLQQLFSSRAETTLWLTCVDCAESAEELQPYMEVIQPKYVFAMHFDGLMPDVSEGLQESFQEPEWYPHLLESASAIGISPGEYFAHYQIVNTTLQ